MLVSTPTPMCNRTRFYPTCKPAVKLVRALNPPHMDFSTTHQGLLFCACPSKRTRVMAITPITVLRVNADGVVNSFHPHFCCRSLSRLNSGRRGPTQGNPIPFQVTFTCGCCRFPVGTWPQLSRVVSDKCVSPHRRSDSPII